VVESEKLKQKTIQKEAKLHISQTNSNGSFRCPSCGTKISPDDHTEATYSLYDIKLEGNDLDEVVIYCKNCLRLTHLCGFKDVYGTISAPLKIMDETH
jgi:transposase-like protein